MPRKTKTIQDFINEAKIVHGELYDYSKTNYVHALTKIIITCKIIWWTDLSIKWDLSVTHLNNDIIYFLPIPL